MPIATHRSSVRIPSCIALCLLTLTALPLFAQSRVEPMPGDYRILDGQVDRGTYTGWRLFHSTCYVCHGVDALGTDVAPNLVERIKTLTPRAFVTKVLTSYRIVLPADDASADPTAAREAMIDEVMRKERGSRGEIVMPAWEGKARIKPHVLDLYAYLSARADGKLGPGKPRLMVEKSRSVP
jgi:mono/diheme cytochrome c family protein